MKSSAILSIVLWLVPAMHMFIPKKNGDLSHATEVVADTELCVHGDSRVISGHTVEDPLLWDATELGSKAIRLPLSP